MELLFPFAEYWWAYLGFIVFVGLMLVLDLGVFHRKAHEVSLKEAAGWTVVWIALALLFNVGFYYFSLHQFQDVGIAKQVSLEFLTGYVVEKSLAVDNIFVFVVVFSYFGVPLKYQHRVLFFGILGALLFRGVFIGLGSFLMRFSWVEWVFGAFLILTGIKMMFTPEAAIRPEDNLLVRGVRRLIPVTNEFHGQQLFVKLSGVLYATPLFVCLIFLEFTDVVFAVDSVPAIFALTKEPLIVFTSNIFAILGLRAMYFMLAGVMERFEYLKYGLALVLIFVGLKMAYLNHAFGGKFPVTWSLAIIGALIFGSGAFSWLKTKKTT
jgi:tellurite resistance protein TerC